MDNEILPIILLSSSFIRKYKRMKESQIGFGFNIVRAIAGCDAILHWYAVCTFEWKM